MKANHASDSASALLAAATLYNDLSVFKDMGAERLGIEAKFQSESSRRWWQAVIAEAKGTTKGKPLELTKRLRNIVACELVALKGHWHECKVDGVAWIPLFMASRTEANDVEFFKVLGEALRTSREPTFSPLECFLIENWDQWEGCFQSVDCDPPLKSFTAPAARDLIAMRFPDSLEGLRIDDLRKTIKKLGLKQELPARVGGVAKVGSRIEFLGVDKSTRRPIHDGLF